MIRTVPERRRIARCRAVARACVPPLLLAAGVCAAQPSAPPEARSWFASRSLAARGPVALSLAAEPRGLHWGLESGIPLGLGARAGPGRAALADGPWRLDAFMNASHDRSDAREPNGLGGALRIEHARDESAWWLGLATGGARLAGDPRARLRLAAGRVTALAGLRTELSFVTSSVLFRDDPRWPGTRTLRYFEPRDSGEGVWRDSTVRVDPDHAALWYTPQAALRWQRGRWSLESVAGLSLGEGVRGRRWAQGTVELQVARRVLFAASFGERPAAALAFSGEANPRTMLGVRVAPWASEGWAMSGALKPAATAWRTQRVSPEHLLFRVHARDTGRVEIAADFTDWLPVELPAVRAGWWATVLRVPPGVHRVQLRLNGGAWIVPPGLPHADAGLSGPTGTLLVEPAD